MTNNEIKLAAELAFMYKKYEELCAAYKRLATEQGKTQKTVNDMSKMTFKNKEE